MSQITEAVAKIKDLNSSFLRQLLVAIIHLLNNLESYFWPYLAILSRNAQKKEKLSTLNELTKALKDEYLCLSNKNKGATNNAHSPKPNTN